MIAYICLPSTDAGTAYVSTENANMLHIFLFHCLEKHGTVVYGNHTYIFIKNNAWVRLPLLLAALSAVMSFISQRFGAETAKHHEQPAPGGGGGSFRRPQGPSTDPSVYPESWLSKWVRLQHNHTSGSRHVQHRRRFLVQTKTFNFTFRWGEMYLMYLKQDRSHWMIGVTGCWDSHKMFP